MGGNTEQDREERAFEALVASALRQEKRCDDVDEERLPELTEEEEEAMESLGTDFVKRVIAGEIEEADRDGFEASWEAEDPSVIGELVAGLNRGDGGNEEVLRQRQRILEEKAREDGRDEDGK